MLRKVMTTLALSAALVGGIGTAASAQPMVAQVSLAGPPVYIGVEVGPPGPGYIWVPRFHRWVYRGYGWGPGYWRAPTPYVWAPRPWIRRGWDGRDRGWDGRDRGWDGRRGR
jgi:hypothetical protein